MQRVVFALTCLACTGHARRVHPALSELHPSTVTRSEENAYSVLNQLEVLSRFFLGLEPAAAFTSLHPGKLAGSCSTASTKQNRHATQVANGGRGISNLGIVAPHAMTSQRQSEIGHQIFMSDDNVKENDAKDLTENNDTGVKESEHEAHKEAAAAAVGTTVAAAAVSAAGRLRLLNRHQLSVAAILAACFLNLLGFTMAGPITPALGAHFGLEVGASLGWLTSAYPLGMLVGLLLWPRLSDRVGRKPVMALSFLGTGLGLLMQGLAVRQCWSFTAFLGLRAITGSMAGASPVAKAYLADVGAGVGKLPRYMAWRDAASTLAFIVGPLISGHLYLGRQAVGLGQDRSLAAVIATSGVYSLLASVLIALFVSERPPTPKKVPEQGDARTDAQATDTAAQEPTVKEKLAACPLGATQMTAVATVCVISALFNFGTAPFDAFFPSLVKDLVGLDEGGIGKAKASLATLSFVISATLSASIQKRLGVVTTCALGLSASAIGLAGFSSVVAHGAALSKSMQMGLFWTSAAMYQVGIPLFGPTISTMLLQCVSRQRRGAIMGLDSSINAVARIVSAPLLGALYAAAGPAFCFGTAGAILLLSAATALVRRFVVMRGLYEK